MSPRRLLAFDLLVLGIGGFALWVFSRGALRSLCWSDEIVYAVMARNIAAGRGMISNLYHSRAILEGGFPLGDVHMPGHALFCSLFFRLFGTGEAVAFLPSQVAYVAAGWATARVGRRMFGSGVGLAAAVLLYLTPALGGYALSAMAECTVVLASAVFLYLLVVTAERGGAGRAAALALWWSLCLLCRESLAVLGVLALFAVWPRRRERAVFVLVSLLAIAALVPAYRGRARYPHFLASLPAGGGIVRAVIDRAILNTELPLAGATVPEWIFAAQLAVGVLLPAIVIAAHPPDPRRSAPDIRALAGGTLYLFLTTFAGLTGFYTIKGWTGMRMVLFAAPWTALLVAGLCLAPTRRRLLPLSFLVAAGYVWLDIQAASALTRDRAREHQHALADTEYMLRLTAGRPLRGVIASRGFEFAWRAFPVVVIWDRPLDPATIRRLSSYVPIDGILAPADAVPGLLAASEDGELGARFRLAGRDTRRTQLLLREALPPAAGGAAERAGKLD